jgi:DNA topoisomerase-6 subunit B
MTSLLIEPKSPKHAPLAMSRTKPADGRSKAPTRPAPKPKAGRPQRDGEIEQAEQEHEAEALLIETGEGKSRSRDGGRSGGRAPQRATAESMAAKQREISVSEFFAKNRHLLGFDNPRKALLTTVKEAVDNALDACEEAGILPCITVVIEDLQPERAASVKQSRYRVTVIDNGPGIVRKQIENVFGRLLYGSKFHRLKMSRGQQGIGISAAGMYGLITTGKPMVIHTRPGAKKPAHHIELAMNTKTNTAEVTVDKTGADFPPQRFRMLNAGTRDASFLNEDDYAHGTSVSIELEGRYQKGRGSVDEFLELVAIANPHAQIWFVPPTRVAADEQEGNPPLPLGEGLGVRADTAAGDDRAHPHLSPLPKGEGVDPSITTLEKDGVILFPRGTDQLPPETREIQPHPRGIELGTLLQMIKDFEAQNKRGGTLYNFLQERFCRVSSARASEFCKAIGVTSRTRAGDLEPPQVEKLFKQFQESRLAPPPTDCLAPIGVRQMLAGLLKGVKAEFYAASSRDPDVYRGRPFQIEAAIAFGGELAADDTARVIRFANRVPLQFQQSACSSMKACIETIADYDEIRKEMKLALMECGRKLGTYLRKRQAMRRQAERRDVFARYIGEIAQAIHAIIGGTKDDQKKLYDKLMAEAKKRTAIADAQLDDEGRMVKKGGGDDEDLSRDEGVVMVAERVTSGAGGGDSPLPVGEGSGVRADADQDSAGKGKGDKVRMKAKARKSKKRRDSGGDELF